MQAVRGAYLWMPGHHREVLAVFFMLCCALHFPLKGLIFHSLSSSSFFHKAPGICKPVSSRLRLLTYRSGCTLSSPGLTQQPPGWSPVSSLAPHPTQSPPSSLSDLRKTNLILPLSYLKLFRMASHLLRPKKKKKSKFFQKAQEFSLVLPLLSLHPWRMLSCPPFAGM